MGQTCIFLGKKTGQYYCRKCAGTPCPSGQISTCPCIPKDFWNIETITKNRKKKEAPQKAVAEESKKPAITELPSVNNTQSAYKKEHIRDFRVFKI